MHAAVEAAVPSTASEQRPVDRAWERNYRAKVSEWHQRKNYRFGRGAPAIERARQF